MELRDPVDGPSTVEEIGKLLSPSGTPELAGYDILEVAGRGGMGKVYRARHRELNRIVALKVLTHEPDANLLARFREEARAVAKLQHPNISQLYDTGTVDGRPYFTQEFLSGGTLSQLFNGQPQQPAVAANIVEQIARAIHHSHEQGILHRDLKPGNVMLTDDGTPKVTDFGLAKSIGPADVNSTRSGPPGLTQTGEVLGTPAYMPPEQASGIISQLGPTADIYSLGAILYEALTGRPPFQAADVLQILYQVLTQEPVSPRTFVTDVPRDIETICLKCLEKSPKRRYATAAALADDLQRFRTGEPILARPVGPVERLAKWAKRKKTAAALVAVSIVLGLTVIGFAVAQTINSIRLRKTNDQLEASNEELKRVNADLDNSRRETESMLGYTLETMDNYHFALSNKLALLPQGEPLRVEVLNQARATLDNLFQMHPNRKIVRDYLMYGYQQLGNALSQIGNVAGAADAYKRAAEVSDLLLKDEPASLRYRADRGTLLLQYSNVQEQRGRRDVATAEREEGTRLAVELDAESPDDAGVIRLNLLAVMYRFRPQIESGTPLAMIPVYRRWVELFKRLARVQPENPGNLYRALEYELTLVGLYTLTQNLPEAEAILKRTKDVVDALPNGNDPAVRLLRTSYHEGVGSVATGRERYSDADAAYRLALQEYERLVKDFPNSPNYRHKLVNIWSRIGNLWVDAGKPDVGIPALVTARDLAAALNRESPDNPRWKETLEFLDKQIRMLKK